MPLTDKGGPAQLNLWEGNGAPGLTARGGTWAPAIEFMSDRVKLAREITAADHRTWHIATGAPTHRA